jgi:hypothetical protein
MEGAHSVNGDALHCRAQQSPTPLHQTSPNKFRILSLSLSLSLSFSIFLFDHFAPAAAAAAMPKR